MKTARGRDFEALLPHRGANMLIDEAVWDPDNPATPCIAKIRLAAGDPMGRDIFLTRTEPSLYIPYFFAEYMALASICLLQKDIEGGKTAVYSSIGSFDVKSEVPAGTPLVGTVTRGRDKGPFRAFTGSAGPEGGPPAIEGEVMAAVADLSQGSGEAPAPQPVPEVKERRVVDKRAVFPWKHPALVFADEVVASDLDARTLVTRYSYPAGHPFVPGHFPGRPIMMGICQWMALADAGFLLHRELKGKGRMTPEQAAAPFASGGEIVRKDGTLVAQVRSIELVVTDNGRPRLLSSRRMSFRGMVVPGDELFISVQAR